jgi:hypothetical protein
MVLKGGLEHRQILVGLRRLKPSWLLRAFQRLRRRAAPGVNGATIDWYEVELEGNILRLLTVTFTAGDTGPNRCCAPKSPMEMAGVAPWRATFPSSHVASAAA